MKGRFSWLGSVAGSDRQAATADPSQSSSSAKSRQGVNSQPSRRHRSIEVAFGEDHVRVGGGVPVTLPIPDEDHDSAGGLVGEDALTFAGTAHEAVGMAVGKGHPCSPAVEGSEGRDDRDCRSAQLSKRRLDIEAEAVADDLDRDLQLERPAGERCERRIVRLRLGQPDHLGGVARQHLDLALEERSRTHEAGVVGLVVGAVLLANELVEDLVGDVRGGDRAVVVHEQRQRRLAWAQRWYGYGGGGGCHAGLVRHAGRIPARRGHRFRASRRPG